MADPVRMVVPQLGNAVDDVTVSGWLVAVGDVVEAGEPVVEVDADKASSELVAPVAGTIAAIHAPDGAVVEVGGLLAEIEAAL